MARLFRTEKIPPIPSMAGKFNVTLARDMCKACGFCINACPTDVFAWSTRINTQSYVPVDVVHEEQCVGCMLCFQICPDFCLNVERKASANGGATT
jgi:2-oxoglutarate ferredoxin oxidoreductase subunit delta